MKQQTAFLESLDGTAAILDKQGLVVCVNEDWSRFGSENAALPRSLDLPMDKKEAMEKTLAQQVVAQL